MRELQGRLKFLGYYHGEVDGIFGYKTLQSVMQFQSAFGMKVDGIAGSKTKLKLWEATKAWRRWTGRWQWAEPPKQPNNGSSQHNDNLTASIILDCRRRISNYMANAVYGEARGEPYEGKWRRGRHLEPGQIQQFPEYSLWRHL